MVPQGMSYASLAGLPSVYGLYGAFVPVLCYAALGSSRHLVHYPSTLPSPPFNVIQHCKRTCMLSFLLATTAIMPKYQVFGMHL